MTEATMQRLEQRVDRVRDHSAEHVNRRIAREIDASVAECTRRGRDEIVRRLAVLEREWDIDRVLMANFAVAGGIAYGVGLERSSRPRFLGFRRRPSRWLYFLGAQLGFLLLHATVGWCPPMVVWRRLGARTKTEIELERSLLQRALEQALRAGDPAVPGERQ